MINKQRMTKEKIAVCVRIRPLNNVDEDKKNQEVVFSEGKTIKMNLEDVSRISAKSSVTKFFDRQKKFEFDNVYNQQCNTTELYDEIVHDIVMKSLRGINSTVFVYGQTGSGKTYTMTGTYFGNQKNIYLEQCKRLKSKSPVRSSRNHLKSRTPTKQELRPSTPLNEAKKSVRTLTKLPRMNRQSVPKTEGLIMMALKRIFKEIEVSEKQGEEFAVKLSYIEIYNENVYDLLRDFEKHDEETLQIYEDIKKSEFYVRDAHEECITSCTEAIEVLKRGEKNRHFAATNLNHNSSRSHALFRIMVKYVDKDNQVYESTCNFVDLAGSEKLSKYEDENNRVKSDRIKESKSINKSLFFLTQIINFKSTMKNDSFVPYRNSPLTKILKSSIGGNAKTAIILCINPAFMNLEQTLGTLKFGNLASRIENVVKKNTVTGDDQDLALKNMLRDYENKLKDLETRLKGEDKSGDYLERIRLLEESKRMLQQKYQNLINLSLRISKIKDTGDVMSQVQHTRHMSSCGVVEYYRLEKLGEIDKNCKQKRMPENFFIKNKDYTKEFFKNDVLKGKLKIIKELEAEKEEMRKRLEKHQQQEKLLKEQNKLCFRFLTVLLNSNHRDFSLFDHTHRALFIDNSLKMIENCKLQDVNEKLIQKEHQPLPLLSNEQEQLKFNNILNHFSSVLNTAKTGKVNESKLLKESTNMSLLKKSHDQKDVQRLSMGEALKENETVDHHD